MDVGLGIDNPVLSAILGKAAYPLYDEKGNPVIEGSMAFTAALLKATAWPGRLAST